MVAVSSSSIREARAATGPAGPPPWAVRLLGEPVSETLETGATLRRSRDARFAMASVTLPEADRLSAERFRAATVDAYQRLHAALEPGPAHHLVRVWNFIPGILEPLDDLPQRYMVFNAGRFEAYSAWYPDEASFASQIATASGVGHDGCDLQIHALAARTPGEPVENPRQISSYRYSRCHGPRPPCFSRATRIRVADGEPSWLLIGGTASICGEDTRHQGDLAAQLDETMLNLEALVGNGAGPGDSPCEAGSVLERFRHLRVYFVRANDEGWVRREVTARFPGLEDLEVHRADLCRPGLLIEIEGVATLG